MMDFTYPAYRELLEYLKGLGYSVTPFREFPDQGPAVILRHDIDFSVPKALEMAELDHQAKIRSTFFVLMSSPFYNALENSNIALVRKIADLGHEIGLHYETTALKGLSVEDTKRHVQSLVDTLQCVIGVPVTSVSKHKPTASGIPLIFTEYRDAYDPKYFRDIPYLSDSRMKFGVDDVYSFFRNNTRSQLCIHPIWWNRKQKSIPEIFSDLLRIEHENMMSHFETSRISIEKYLREKYGPSSPHKG